MPSCLPFLRGRDVLAFGKSTEGRGKRSWCRVNLGHAQSLVRDLKSGKKRRLQEQLGVSRAVKR